VTLPIIRPVPEPDGLPIGSPKQIKK
jgi:hypothetical protein